MNVVYVYDDRDRQLRDQLANHLSSLSREGLITEWHIYDIPPGEERDRVIRDNLQAADIILLLVSSYFLKSGDIMDVQLPLAMKRYKVGEAKVIPIILRACD